MAFKILALGLLICSASAMAQSGSSPSFPASGDDAVFTMTLTDPYGNMQTGTYEVNIASYEDSINTFVETITTGLLGQPPQIQQGVINASQLPSDAQAQEVLANCASYGGDLEVVQTGMGPINSCAVPVVGNGYRGISWAADVPFGYSKMSQTDQYGANQTYVLKSYVSGLATPPPYPRKK